MGNGRGIVPRHAGHFGSHEPVDDGIFGPRVEEAVLGVQAINHAAQLMGLHGYARGGGEIYKLETPYWETPEYYQDPIKGERAVHPREKPTPGKRGRPKNLPRAEKKA